MEDQYSSDQLQNTKIQTDESQWHDKTHIQSTKDFLELQFFLLFLSEDSSILKQRKKFK